MLPGPHACVELHADTKLLLEGGENGFKLRVAFETFGHVAHFSADGTVAGIVSLHIFLFTCLMKFLPAVHETVGAAFGTGADFGLELKRTHGSVNPVRSRLADKTFIFHISCFRIFPAVGSHFIEGLAGTEQFVPLFRACLATPVLGLVLTGVDNRDEVVSGMGL